VITEFLELSLEGEAYTGMVMDNEDHLPMGFAQTSGGEGLNLLAPPVRPVLDEVAEDEFLLLAQPQDVVRGYADQARLPNQGIEDLLFPRGASDCQTLAD